VSVDGQSDTELIEAERRRLAHELHDGLAQLISAARWQIERLVTHQRAGGAIAADALEAAAKPLELAVHELRRSIQALHPPDLEFGLISALQRLTEGLPADVALAIDPAAEQLRDSHGLAIYRIVQEALRNAVRHGRAQQIAVQLRHSADGWTLEIHDDGQGFDVTQRPRESFGLRTIQSRVEELGGGMEVDSRHQAGTRLRIEFPIR
jgi:signal transduction histidine kinase